jgi:hypothetical protein
MRAKYCFPVKIIKRKSKIYKPWISKGILKSIKRKNKLYKSFLQNQNPIAESKYKVYKNKLTHSIRIAKRIYFDMKLNENKSNMKATWKILNNIINRKNTKPKINSIFKLDGRVTLGAFEISNQFCNYFSNIGVVL